MTITHRKSFLPLIATFVLMQSAQAAQWTERTTEIVRTTEVQVLTSGPVHEAFAETVIYDPEPDMVVMAPPPEALDEQAPDQMPDDPDMTWIPGYWAWDDDRDDYLWVSGIWRSVPPSRRYVPGYWTRVGPGYQWTSGFWMDEDAVEIVYLPEPPERIDPGPPPPAPAPNLLWSPGTWVWDYDRYVWRPGYWVEATPDWLWVPSHYVWGPRGYVFVDGYWDRPIERRGVLFAPVYVSPAMRVARYTYAPTTVIDLEIFTDHLFVRPRYRHYYFGDYYATAYVDKGIYPWFSVQARHVGYDPIYVQRRWVHRHEPEWERRVEVDYHRRRDNERERPPRTLAMQLQFDGDRAQAAVKGLFVAKTLQQMAQNNKNRFKTVDPVDRDAINQRAREATKARESRKEVETKDEGVTDGPVKRTTPVRNPIPPTVVTKKSSPTNKSAAPKAPEASKLDRSVEPKPKQKVERVTRQPKPPEREPTKAPESKPSERPGDQPGQSKSKKEKDKKDD